MHIAKEVCNGTSLSLLGSVRRGVPRKVKHMPRFDDVQKRNLGLGDSRAMLVSPTRFGSHPSPTPAGFEWLYQTPLLLRRTHSAEKRRMLGTASRGLEIDEDTDKGMNRGPAVTFSVCLNEKCWGCATWS